jgi:hypothetical protein
MKYLWSNTSVSVFGDGSVFRRSYRYEPGIWHEYGIVK